MKKKFAIIAVWIAVWEVLSLAISNPVLMAGPFETLKAFLAMAATGEFWLSVGRSAARVLGGMVCGTLSAWIFACLAYRHQTVKEVLAPFFQVLKSVPVVSFIVLVLLWSKGNLVSFIISWIVVMPMYYFSFLEGFSDADPKMLEMAEMYRMKPSAVLRYVYGPSVLSHMTGTTKSAVGLGFRSGAAAEVIGQVRNTVGNGIYLSKVFLSTEELFAWTLTVVILSWITEKAAVYGLEKAGRTGK